METITTDKEAFEYIRTHLLTQGEPAFNISDDCGYRGHTRSQINELENKSNECHDFADYGDEYDDRMHYFIVENWDTLPYAKCAVGCIIKDEHYDSSYEGNSVDDDGVLESIMKSHPNWEEPSIRMLSLLQRVHDTFSFGDWDKVLDSQNWSFDLDGDFVSYSGYKEETVTSVLKKNNN